MADIICIRCRGKKRIVVAAPLRHGAALVGQASRTTTKECPMCKGKGKWK